MFDLDRRTSLLLVVDIQEKLACSMPQDEFERFLEKAKILIRGAKILGLPILQSLQYKKGLGESFRGLFDGDIASIDFEKRSFSCCYEGSELLQFLANNPHKKQIIIIGMEAHICVLQTARDLLRRHIEVNVIQDGVISRDINNKQNALDLMRDLGVNIVNTESVLFDLLKTSLADEFKAISNLIK